MGQAAHGSAPDIAGQNIANPYSQVVSASMLLAWHGARSGQAAYLAAAKAIDAAVAQAIAAGECTRDVGGHLGTCETGQALLQRLRS